jgi:hypothetical protein
LHQSSGKNENSGSIDVTGQQSARGHHSKLTKSTESGTIKAEVVDLKVEALKASTSSALRARKQKGAPPAKEKAPLLLGSELLQNWDHFHIELFSS